MCACIKETTTGTHLLVDVDMKPDFILTYNGLLLSLFWRSLL